jgi:hypothetical protein
VTEVLVEEHDGCVALAHQRQRLVGFGIPRRPEHVQEKDDRPGQGRNFRMSAIATSEGDRDPPESAELTPRPLFPVLLKPAALPTKTTRRVPG